MGAKSLHAGGRTDRQRGRHDEAFHNFANAPKPTRSTAIKMDSKVLCKAKYASVTTKVAGQFIVISFLLMLAGFVRSYWGTAKIK